MKKGSSISGILMVLSVQVNIANTDMYIEHGGLEGRYKAAQFHFHWGQGAHGSEHTLQGSVYPMEVRQQYRVFIFI